MRLRLKLCLVARVTQALAQGSLSVLITSLAILRGSGLNNYLLGHQNCDISDDGWMVAREQLTRHYPRQLYKLISSCRYQATFSSLTVSKVTSG